ncbi:hypothetical protein BDL97_05G118200 [Sphagnum fallax]|nr:hypothetical protein BDL97_05G118200 [Sphagnum fallax]
MGLCASRALGVLENLEEEMREEEESSSNSSLQIVSEASSAAAGGMSMSSSSSSNGGTRRSMRSMMRSRNSTTLFKATTTTTTLSFDSSRSSAEVGEMGKLGALLCKRRPFVGNPDILSAHLTNLLNSMLLQRTTAQETKSPAEISFASYLSTPFIRPQGTFFQRQFYNAMEDDDDDRDDGGGLSAIAKSYAESAAKAAARDTFLFLEKNDRSLQSFEITVEEEEEEEEIQEEEEEETSRVAMSSSDDSRHHPGTVELFRPHGMYYEQEEEEEEEIVEIAAAAAQHKSYSFQFSYPATTTTTSSRSKMICEESSTSSIGTQPSMLLKTAGTIPERRRSSSELAAPKSKNSGSNSETPAEVTPLQDADSKLGQEHSWGCKQVAEEGLEAADAGERGDCSGNVKEGCMQDSRSNKDPMNLGCSLTCPAGCLQIGVIATGKDCIDDPSCSSSSRMCGNPTQYQPQHEEEEEEEVPDNPDSSFFSFPSSPSSKLFEEVGSGHIIEQMKSTKLMQEMACRKAVEEFQQEVGGFEGHPRCHAESAAGAHSRNVAFGSPFAVAAAATRSCHVEEVEMMTTTTMTTQERAAPRSCQLEEARITTHERAAAAAHSSFDKRLKFFSLERACNAAISKRFVVLESIASAQDTTCFSHPRDGHHATSSHESSCESFRIDDNTQGVRMMSFTRKDFACLQMKKCVGVNVMADLPSGTATAASESGTLRNLIHGSKAVRKASTRAKSLKDTPKKPKYLEQVEESAATSLSSTGKGLVLLKLGLLRRKHLAVKNTAEKSVSPTINPSPSVSISRSVDVENKPP